MGAINRLIEEVALKQVEDAIVLVEMLSQQIIETSKTAKANQINFGSPATSNDDMSKKLAQSEATIKKLQTQYNTLQKSYGDLSKKLDQYTKSVDNNDKAKKKLSERDRQLVIDSREITKIQDNEARVLSGLTTYMQKLIAVRGQYAQVVADYNAKIAMGVKLSNDEQFELYQSMEAHKKYDTAIKAGNLSVGRAQELVGQYARANTGLANSINQISRELPSATFGFQTFALGISNNVPIAVDSIKEAVRVNKELIAQGQPTVSVWKQVVGAIFSFNTIMSVGLLLLAVFGKEIGNAVTNLFGMAKAIDLNKVALEDHIKAVEKFNEKASTMASDEISRAKKLLETAKNRDVSDKQRQKAVDELQRRYPSYLGNLKQEDILTGNISKAEIKLINALRLRAIAMASQDLLTENLKAQIKAELEYSKIINKTTDAKNLYDDAGNTAVKTSKGVRMATEEEAESLENLEARQKASTETVNNYGKVYQLQQQTNDNIRTKALIPLKKEEEVLELIFQKYMKYLGVVEEDTDNTDKNSKSIKLNVKAREDYLASLFELEHLRLTNLANANKDILDDEASSYELRAMASAEYYNNLLDLANSEAKEELRILEFSTEDKLRTTKNEYANQKEQLDNQLKDEKITRAFYNEQLKIYEEQFNYDITGIKQESVNKQNIIFENQAQKLIEANKATANALAKIWDEINFGKADLQIGNIDLTGIQKLGEVLKGVLGGIGKDTDVKEIQRQLEKVQEIAKNNANDINKREAQLSLDRAERNRKRLENEIRTNGEANNLSEEQITSQLDNNKALQDADQQIIDSKKRVAEADNAITQTQIDNQIKLLNQQKEVDDAIYQGKVELYSSIKDLAGQLFENQIEDYENQISESNDYYDNLISNAEKGSEQEKALQEEKQAREEELQKRKIDLLRKQAIFNKLLGVADIAIKLQSEIAKNNAELGTVLAQPINALAIASAGVRVATILATPLPQYEEGTDYHAGGKALVGEKRTEVVENPDGSLYLTPNKPTIVDLKKGAKVHKSLEEFGKSKFGIENASIMASLTNQSNQLRAFDYYIGNQLNGLPERIEKGIDRGFKKAKNSIFITIPKGSNNNSKPRNFA